MKRIIVSLTTLTALSLAGVAMAQPGGVKKADLNGDGAISLAEFTAKANARFDKTDSNLDGVITPDERKAARTVKMAERRAARFDKIDANGDGFLSRAETESQAAERAQRRETRKAERAQNRAEGGERAQNKRQKRDRSDQTKRREKRDPNAVITRADHDSRTAERFAKMDKNGDGVLSGDELKRKKSRKKRGGKKRRG